MFFSFGCFYVSSKKACGRKLGSLKKKNLPLGVDPLPVLGVDPLAVLSVDPLTVLGVNPLLFGVGSLFSPESYDVMRSF